LIFPVGLLWGPVGDRGSRPRWWCTTRRSPDDPVGSLEGGQLWLWLGNGVGVLLVFDGLLAGLGGQFEAHVSTLFGPFVGLLGQDRTDEADDRGSVGEDPDDVGAAADLLVEPLNRYLELSF